MNKERYLESESLSHLTYLLNCLKTKERWKDYTTEFYFNGAWHVDFTVKKVSQDRKPYIIVW